jgi:Tol biopolymer transport system component
MANRLIILWLIIFILAGCQSAPAPTAERATATPTAITLPTPTIYSTPTKLAPLNELIRKCIEVSPSHSWTTALSGTLILSKSMTENYLMDMGTGKKTQLNPNKDLVIGNFVVSPNKRWFAYEQGGKSQPSDLLVVQSADGKEKMTYSKDNQEWNTISYWLNDETLVLWHSASPLSNIVYFNPFTGRKQIMMPDYPNILPDDYEWTKFSWPSITIYAPSMKQLVYLKTNLTGTNDGDVTLVLWDQEEKRAVAEITNFGFTIGYPIWKSDNSGLVYKKALTGYSPPHPQDELFSLSSDGVNQQLTKLSDYYQDDRIYNYTISPNGQLLAFVLYSISKSSQTEQTTILTLDMSTHEITDYCLVAGYSSSLSWSPDSHYLAYSEPTIGESSRTVVLDLIKEDAFVIDPDLASMGWLTKDN